MGKILFAFVMLFQAFAGAGESKTFNCQMTKFKSVDVFLDEEINLKKNPVLRLEERSYRWLLQIGDKTFDTRQEGPRLRKYRRFINSTWLQYSFYKNGILDFQFEYNVFNHTADLYWWGTARKSFMASFDCDVKLR